MAYTTPKDIAKAGIATGATREGDTRPGAEERPERREPAGAR